MRNPINAIMAMNLKLRETMESIYEEDDEDWPEI